MVQALKVACGLLLWTGVAAGSTDPLTYLGFQRDMILDGATDVAMSANGLSVYVVAEYDNAVSIFWRSTTTGQLGWVGAVRSSDVGADIIDVPTAVAISPDGGTVYVVGESGLAVFQRNTSSGALTYLEVHRDGEGGLTTLDGLQDVAVSPDDKHVLVTAMGDDSLTVFSRDRTTGRLTLAFTYTDGSAGVDGLDGAWGVALSPDGESVYVTGYVDDAVAEFDRNPVTGVLTFIDVLKDSYVGVSGLDGARQITVSPDGANVYATGWVFDTIAVFQRNPDTGLLSFVHSLEDDSAGIDGLQGIWAVVASPDGQHVYTTSVSDHAIAVFARSPTDGALSQLGMVANGDAGFEGMWAPEGAVITTDGTAMVVVEPYSGVRALSRNASTGFLGLVDHEDSAPGLDGPVGITADFGPCVYVAGNWANGIQSMRRDGPSRPLTTVNDFSPFSDPPVSTRSVVAPRRQSHVYFAGYDTDDIVRARYSGSAPCLMGSTAYLNYVNGENGIVGLVGPQHMTLSPDEAQLYVAAADGDAVVIFTRDTTNGNLTYLGTAFDGLGGVDGLDGAYWVEVSPDGAHLYVAGYYDDAIAVFSRNPTTGHLTFLSVVRDGVGGVDGLAGVSSVVVSPDGAHVYGAGRIDDAIAIFSRNPSTGALTSVGRVVDGVSGVDGLNGARALAVSPDGAQVYAASQHDHALAVFSRDPATGLLTQVGLHVDGAGGVNGLATANGIAVSPDGVQVYVTGYGDNAVATFVRSELVIFDDGFESGGTDQWSATVGQP